MVRPIVRRLQLAAYGVFLLTLIFAVSFTVHSEAFTDLGSSPPMNHYTALGITLDATDAQIRRAYRAKALMYHPDKFQRASEFEQSQAKMHYARIRSAYDLLSSDERCEYDVRYMGANPWQYKRCLRNAERRRRREEEFERARAATAEEEERKESTNQKHETGGYTSALIEYAVESVSGLVNRCKEFIIDATYAVIEFVAKQRPLVDWSKDLLLYAAGSVKSFVIENRGFFEWLLKAAFLIKWFMF